MASEEVGGESQLTQPAPRMGDELPQSIRDQSIVDPDPGSFLSPGSSL